MLVPEPKNVPDLVGDTAPVLAATGDLDDIDVVVLIALVRQPFLDAQAVAAALIFLRSELDVVLTFPIPCIGQLFEPDIRGALPDTYRLLKCSAVGGCDRSVNDVRQETTFPSLWLTANVVRHDGRDTICTSVQNVRGAGEDDVSLHNSLIVNHLERQGIALSVDLIREAVRAATNCDFFIAVGEAAVGVLTAI
jgi:hypothetical protein